MFPCAVCEKVYKAKRSMLAHVKTQHEGRKFTCAVCAKTYTRKHDMLRHKKLTHVVNIERPLPVIAFVQQRPHSTTDNDTVGLWAAETFFGEAIVNYSNQSKKIHYYYYSNIDTISDRYHRI